MTNDRKILAFILARGGSTGVPGKNIRPLAGKPLVAHTIEVAKTSRFINRVIVATDHADIARVAREAGAEVPFDRPGDLSGTLSRAYDVYRWFLARLKDTESYRPDIFVMLFGTSFSKSIDDVDRSIEKLIETDCDWVFTVTPVEHHPYRFFVPEGDRMRPFCGDVPSRDLWGNRQELPPVVRINGNAFVTWTENIENFSTYNIDGVAHPETDIRFVECPQERSLDIDTEHDFAFAELVMRARSRS